MKLKLSLRQLSKVYHSIDPQTATHSVLKRNHTPKEGIPHDEFDVSRLDKSIDVEYDAGHKTILKPSLSKAPPDRTNLASKGDDEAFKLNRNDLNTYKEPHTNS